MADASFDVVYAGGGFAALYSAPYFAMNGMSVGVFEGRHELGGGHASDARPTPSFVGNPHAQVLLQYTNPAMQDFKLWEKGVKILWPDRFASFLWPDGNAMCLKRVTDWDIKTGSFTFSMMLQSVL